MKTVSLVLVICVAAVASLPRQQERIVGGTVASINSYPFAASLQRTTNNVAFHLACGSTILSNRALLSAAHCWPRNAQPANHRVRVGSANRSSGGSFITINRLIGHPQYNPRGHDSDVGIIRVATAIPIGSATVRAANIAGANTVVPDNANFIALGWGQTTSTGPVSEQLRRVALRTVNQATCNSIFRGGITANMLCTHWQGGGRGVCFGDSGTGGVVNNVVVGVASFIGFDRICGSARYPGVFARISRFVTWIRNNA